MHAARGRSSSAGMVSIKAGQRDSGHRGLQLLGEVVRVSDYAFRWSCSSLT